MDSRKPYLQPEFEALRQYQATSHVSDTTDVNGLLGILSGEPTTELLESKRGSQGWQMLDNIGQFTGVRDKDTALAMVRSVFPISVINKLYVLQSSQPLLHYLLSFPGQISPRSL